MNRVRARIAQINGIGLLTESGLPVTTMLDNLRTDRAQLLDMKRVWGADTPQNDVLAQAVNGLSDAIGALEQYTSLKK